MINTVFTDFSSSDKRENYSEHKWSILRLRAVPLW